MKDTVVIRTRPLQPSQLKVLLILYTFRFSSRATLADYLGIPNNTSLYSKLAILAKHKYIASHFDSSYKLNGRPAEYYILPHGLRALRDNKQLEVTPYMLQAVYKDADIGDDFKLRNVMLFTMRNELCRAYQNLQIFTKRDMQPLGYFPKQPPDAFLSLKTKTGIKDFFLEDIEAGTPTFAIDRRIKQLVRYYESNEWDVTDTPFPTILCVCENAATERRTISTIKRVLYSTDTAMQFYTTTRSAAMSAHETQGIIWTNVDEPDELVGL